MDWSKLGESLVGKGAKKRIRKETGQKEPYQREEDWVKNLSDADRRRYEAVDKANKNKQGGYYEDGGCKARKNVLMKMAGRKNK